jgi:hypothetical protein
MVVNMNNPPAFPSGNNVTLGDWRSSGHSGMTLRDYFAAKALQGMLASGNLPKTMPDADIAECSYNLADAMMKAREA